MRQVIPWACAVAGLIALSQVVVAQNTPPSEVEAGLLCDKCRRQMDSCRGIQNLAQRAACEREARACQCPR
jgi:hypothetical protein